MGPLSHGKARDGAPRHLAILLARNMKRPRVKRGYSLKQMAELAQVDPLVLRQIEDGRSEPPLAVAWSVASILDVPFAQLIAGEAPRGAVTLRHERRNCWSRRAAAFARARYFSRERRSAPSSTH